MLSAILSSSCEKGVDFKGEKTSPKIVINSIIHAKSDTGAIKISESVFDYSDQQPKVVENPEIHLSINEKECPQVWLDTVVGLHAYYKFASRLNVGDKVELAAHTPEHGAARGFDNVPAIAEIKNVKTSWFRRNGLGYLRLYVALNDNPQERNFYRIVVRTNDVLVHPSLQEPYNHWDLKDIFVDDEILFNNPTEEDEEGKTPNYYKIFSDEMFSGKEYTLNVYIQHDNFAMDAQLGYVRQSVKVELQTLSEKLYQNLRSQELASGTTGDVFSEPVKIYTNIQGGYGILGIYNSTEKEELIAKKGD
jgi:hypothetical protein